MFSPKVSNPKIPLLIRVQKMNKSILQIKSSRNYKMQSLNSHPKGVKFPIELTIRQSIQIQFLQQNQASLSVKSLDHRNEVMQNTITNLMLKHLAYKLPQITVKNLLTFARRKLLWTLLLKNSCLLHSVCASINSKYF